MRDRRLHPTLLLVASCAGACHHEPMGEFFPNVTVRGTITAAASGVPVAGAVIRVSAFVTSCDEEPDVASLPDTTGANGQYEGRLYYFWGHTPPCLRVDVTPPAAGALAPKTMFVETPADEQVDLPQTLTIDVQLDPQPPAPEP